MVHHSFQTEDVHCFFFGVLSERSSSRFVQFNLMSTVLRAKSPKAAGFPKMGYNNSWMVQNGQFIPKMDDNWGYSQFRKPPYTFTTPLLFWVLLNVSPIPNCHAHVRQIDGRSTDSDVNNVSPCPTQRDERRSTNLWGLMSNRTCGVNQNMWDSTGVAESCVWLCRKRNGHPIFLAGE